MISFKLCPKCLRLDGMCRHDGPKKYGFIITDNYKYYYIQGNPTKLKRVARWGRRKFHRIIFNAPSV